MRGHWIGVLFFLLLGLAGIWFSRMLPTDQTKELGSGFFPLLISVILCGLAVMSLLNLWIKGERFAKPIAWPERSGWLQIFISLILFCGYFLTLERIGFLLSTFVLLLLVARIVFRRPWGKSVLLAVLAVSISYGLLSTLLGVRLPSSPWGWV
jgi:hypothetical protein